MRSRLLRSPTLALLAVLVAVYALQSLVALLADPPTMRSLFALSTPVVANPWTVVTSVYAHSGVGHLVANAVALALVGFPLERETTPLRFHAFFLATGALAGLAEVWLAATVGTLVSALVTAVPPLAGVLPGVPSQVSVIGASGAVFALMGYLLTSNRLTDRVVGNVQLSPRAQIALFALVAAAITYLTASPQVALVAHFTGLLLGLVTGRLHVLRPAATAPSPELA